MIENFFFSDYDYKLQVMGQNNTYFGSLFSEEVLSEEQLVRKFGKNGRRIYQKRSDQKNSYNSSDTKASPGRTDAKV